MGEIEKDFEHLRKFSYNIAMNMIKNHDDAEDIAQNTLLQYISSEDIKNAEAWTRKITQNLVISKFRDIKKSTGLQKELINNPESKATHSKKKLKDYETIPYKQISKYLCKEDRAIYKKYALCNFSIKQYADKTELSYNTASTHIKRIKKNLKAMYLYDKGFNNTATLNKKEWDTIYTMIKRKFLNKTNQIFSIDEYLSFCFNRKEQYHSILVIGRKNSELVFFVVNLTLIRNRIKILEVKSPAIERIIDHKEKAQLLQMLNS